MNDDQTRRVACFNRIGNFGTLHPTDFPAGKKVTSLLGNVRQAAVDAGAADVSQASHGGSARSGTATKADYFDELVDDLKAISRTARAMAEDVPGGLEMKFRMPRPVTQASVLTAAKAFLTDAGPLEAEFVANEMPEDFLTDLAADIAAFEQADDDQDEGKIQRVGSTKSLSQAVAAGMKALRVLDPLMRNKYRNEPGKLAEWLTARHVQRAPRAAKALPPAA